MKFHIENMTCGGCARSVTAAVKQVDAAATVAIDLPTKTATVTSSRPAQEFEKALAEAGFAAMTAAT